MVLVVQNITRALRLCLQSVNDAVESGELRDLSITKFRTPERSLSLYPSVEEEQTLLSTEMIHGV